MHCCLLQALWEQGKRAMPAGTCPTVGIGGHLLGVIRGRCCCLSGSQVAILIATLRPLTTSALVRAIEHASW
jgi:multisubunit Na+/H+ antiporter MnhG subunit